MKEYRIIEIKSRDPSKVYQVQRWVVENRNLFFGIIKRDPLTYWENHPTGVYMRGAGFLRFFETTTFDDITEAIAFVDRLTKAKEIKTVYSV